MSDHLVSENLGAVPDIRGLPHKRNAPAMSSPSTFDRGPITTQSQDPETVQDTPRGVARYHLHVDALQGALEAELEAAWVPGLTIFLERLTSRDHIPDMPSNTEIDGFLKQYKGYSMKKLKWDKVPSKPKREDSALYNPLTTHINVILRHFERGTRAAVGTYAKEMPHVHYVHQTALKMKPDITLMGYGPYLAQNQAIPDPPRYTHCLAPIEVRYEDAVQWNQDRLQLAVYARECLVQQPNRNFVYGVLLTEKRLLLFQFDRAGALFSPWINFHTNARMFIKIILALSTAYSDKLGFDMRIYWDGSTRYFKSDAPAPKIYSIHDPYKPFRRHTIHGRGTTCWLLYDDDTRKKCVLKFAWRTKDREPEYVFLDMIRQENEKRKKMPGQNPIPGVGTVIDYGDSAEVSKLRFNLPMREEGGRDVPERIYYWTLQPYYGQPLEKAPSVSQSLRAFYDILQGGFELWKLGILHRDISTRNMLFNPDPNAEPGQRGFLIDFDMAKNLNSTASIAGNDLRTGTRLFQSIKVLEGVGNHDYLDDLESSFWAYTWIACTSESPGVPRDRIPRELIDWDSPNLSTAIRSKRRFLLCPTSYCLVSSKMGEHVQHMVALLALFFQEKALPRIARIQTENRAVDVDPFMQAYIAKLAPKIGLHVDATHDATQTLDVEAKEWFDVVIRTVGLIITEEEASRRALSPVPDNLVSAQDEDRSGLVLKPPGPGEQQMLEEKKQQCETTTQDPMNFQKDLASKLPDTGNGGNSKKRVLSPQRSPSVRVTVAHPAKKAKQV
ncbi:hypothetical protein NEOLEDRAFT_1093018 [Neolentinus lepideus HHB14362 ss-1]|uniref:Protein kinase domain-containing protein n=1 Tax=Neolentinus lepideus HHB14362 ss-1 TaxID=1314782 RepID=A0A165SHF5_9AGAM|nr:hypothetical protein NEOLEDRAFT_1093018 [Neolentinus lepideus HHB14362 ss-1]